MDITMSVLIIATLDMFLAFILWGIALIKTAKHKLSSQQWRIVRWGHWIFISGFLLLVATPDVLGEGYIALPYTGGLPGARGSVDLDNITSGPRQILYVCAILIALWLMFIGVHFIKKACGKYEQIPEWIKYISNL